MAASRQYFAHHHRQRSLFCLLSEATSNNSQTLPSPLAEIFLSRYTVFPLFPRDAQRDVDLGRSASRASFIALMCSSMRGIAMHIPSEPDVTEGGCCKQTRTLRPLDPCRGREPLLKKLLR